MERLLCIANKMNSGGAETFLMKTYRNIDRSKYQFDFCVTEKGEGFYDLEILSMGGRIFHISGMSKNPFRSFWELYKVVKSNNYKYVLRFGQHSITVIDLLIAKMAGAERTIYRAANSSMTNKNIFNTLLFWIFRPLSNLVPDIKMAPSDLAAEFMFGKRAVKKGKVILLNNGLPLESYQFDCRGRKQIREEIGISDEFVIGHIGRFVAQKNHKQILEIFCTILKEKPSAHLLLVGTGEMEEEIRNKIKELGIDANVHILSERKDIPALLSAMDVFLFPSLFEGMPNAVLEAQANGLPCVVSDSITKLIQVTDNLVMLSLNNPVKIWSDQILYKSFRVPSEVCIEQMREHGYDIKDTVRVFESKVFCS